MKKSTVILVCLLVALGLVDVGGLLVKLQGQSLAVLPPPPPGTTRAHLDWSDYDKNKLSAALTFRVHWSATLNASLTNWLVVATLVGTNTQADVLIPSVDSNSFFAVSGSNLFGLVYFSNVVVLSPPVNPLTPVKVTGVVRP